MLLVAAGGPDGRQAGQITIDVSAFAVMPQEQIKAMTHEVETIWRQYLVLSWVTAPVARHVTETGTILTVVDRSPTASGAPGGASGGLGGIVFREGQVLAESRVTIAVESIAALVDGAVWRGRTVGTWPFRVQQQLVGRALGRVVAHEIGHYLLAWRGHTAGGLMRRSFDRRVLIDPNPQVVAIPEGLLPRLLVRLGQLATQTSSFPGGERDRRDSGQATTPGGLGDQSQRSVPKSTHRDAR